MFSLQNSYAEIIDKLIADVNGEAITLSSLENELKMLNLSDADKAKQCEVLNNLIERELILQEAQRMGIELAITAKEIEEKIATLRSKYPSEEAFLKYLEKEKLSLEYIKERMKESLMVSEMIYRKFMRPLNVNQNLFENKALRYYKNNESKYTEPRKVKIQQVVILSSLTAGEKTAETQSQRIWKKLERGTTFSELNQIYSDDTNVMVDYDPNYIQVNKLVAVLQDAVSKLEIDELSKPILTKRGYFIIKIIDRKPARQKSFGEVADEIKNKLMSKQVQKDSDEWLKKQRETSDIRILDPEYRGKKIKGEK